MSAFHDFAASILDQSASTYAAYAASQLLEQHPETAQRFAPDPFASWKAYLTGRVEDLAVAIELASPQIFVAAVDWSRQSFAARDVPEAHLHAGLGCLQDVLDHELPAPARPSASKYLQAALAGFERPAPHFEALQAVDPSSRLALSYLQACLEGDEHRAMSTVLKAVDSGLGVHDAYLAVLAPALVETGRLWHEARLGVHEEHFITSTTERVMTLLQQRARPANGNGKTVIGAAIQGNAHEIGIRTLMDFFGIAGWRAICLGSSLPAADLAHAARDFRGDLVVLSVTMISQLKFLRSTIEAVRHVAPSIKVIVGGLAFTADPDTWRTAGADAYAPSAAGAVEIGSRLVGLS